MAQKSRPDPASGNAVTADEYEALGVSFANSGVYGTPADTPVVYADSTGRQVKIRAGKLAIVRGYQWFSDLTTDEIVNNGGAGLPANTSGNPRIDRLVLRLDRTARTVRTQYLQGAPAPAGTQQPPALAQDLTLSSGLFDFPLAKWNVADGYTTVAAADLTIEHWYPQPSGVILCTSTSRPFGAVLHPGLEIYETDTGLKQIFTAGNVWQRADWNEAWGLIGGQMYANSGGPFVIGLTSAYSESQGPSSGPVNLKAGRRYMLKATLTWDSPQADTINEFRIREDTLTGTERDYKVNPKGAGATPQQVRLEGFIEPTVDMVGKQFFTTTHVVTTGGASTNVRRTTVGDNETRFEVYDMGPGGKLTTIA